MKTQPTRPLTDLSLSALRRALQATIAAAGADSSSAQALRQAIAAKRADAKRAKAKGASK